MSTQTRKRILIVNVAFDETRRSVARINRNPQAMGPVFLAGAFDPRACDIRVYNEVYSGPLQDRALLGWPDLLVLTGLTTGLDRMRHLTAYARTLNPRVVVAAGGPAIRALPELTRPMFDYACLGDVEQIREVARDCFGPGYTNAEMSPRLDLAYWVNWLGHVESSRNCNFKCSFCSIAGEGRGYARYTLGAVRRQLLDMGYKRLTLFIDQNFYGNDRKYFYDRLELLRELRAAGRLGQWGALVTNDLFYHQQNLDLARESGCMALFSGVESFDADWLRGVNKQQNTRNDPADLIRKCLNSGIVFMYGVMMDISMRSVADLRREIDYIVGDSSITLPAYLCVPVAYPGTKYFNEVVADRRLLPDVKLRDLDASIVTMHPCSPLEEVTRFLADMRTMRGYKARVLRHSLEFVRRYRHTLSPAGLALALFHAGLLCSPELVNTNPLRRVAPSKPRTWVSTTEPLDDLYTPFFPVDWKYRRYFDPVMVTDRQGNLSWEMSELMSERSDKETSIGAAV